MPGGDKEVIIMVIAGGIIFLILTGIVVFVLLFYQKHRFQHARQLSEVQNSYEQQLLTSRLEMQENILEKIGRDLHDNVGQLLTSAKMYMGVAMPDISHPPPALLEVQNTLNKATKELRALSKTFNKDWLNQFNLQENLQLEADRINSHGKLAVIYHGVPDTIPLNASGQIMVFRVVQEAIQNAMKHAQAGKVLIELNVEDAGIEIRVKDDGVGFVETAEKANGVGRINMRQRTQLLNGSITWESEVGKGTEVRIWVPAG